MPGVDLIMAALSAGAAAGITTTTTSAITDSYSRLKSLLGRKDVAIEDLRPDELRVRLTESAAAADEHVLTTAQRLLDLVEQGIGNSANTVTTNHGAVGTFNAHVSFGQPPIPPTSPETT
ncbi:hypothetical protein [Amycolatopsis speibonae]|uniref:Uncharacterized protein n=1 Tax=Amycolatopsis speibonae TaxID=1450224 RepID=A0ABV7PBH1_9PSEU